MVNLGKLFCELKKCFKKDKLILKKRLHGVKKITDEKKHANALEKIAAEITTRQE
ncbi:hypothetical protein [Pseudoalteromonas sp. CAL107-MNA-CIBAN-0098]|uniref:hypothetical protein n=1 Tax=Pseudoalteromonas sp. CAL107-MNA-CIBAN-0098 TaxID=3140433 RepID=UPI00331EAC12